MEKKDFLREFRGVVSGYDVDAEYAWEIYKERVKPYELLITKFRNTDKEKRLTMDQIRVALDVTRSMWDRFKQLPSFRMILDADGDLMRIKAQMDIVKGVSVNTGNAKMLELQAKRFDPFYREEGKDVDTPTKIQFTVVDTAMSDEDIIESTGIKDGKDD